MLLTVASVPLQNLREIAKDGLITLGRDGGSLVPQVSVAFDLATEDASTAFSCGLTARPLRF